MRSDQSGMTPKLMVLIVLAVAVATVGAWVAFVPPVPRPISGQGSGQPSGPASSTAPRPASRMVAGAIAVAGFSPDMTFNAGAGNSIKLVLEGDVTSSSIANPTPGQFLALLLCQDAVGSRQMTWPENLKLSGTLALTKAPDKCDVLTVVYDGLNWHEISRAMNQ